MYCQNTQRSLIITGIQLKTKISFYNTETFGVNIYSFHRYCVKKLLKKHSKETDKETSTSKTETKIVTHTVKPEWRVGGVALVKTQAKGPDLSDYMVYGVNVEKRMFWNIYGGVMATTEKDVGLSLSITF